MIGLQRGTLSIGTIPGLAPLIDIPELLGRFREAHPSVEIRLTSGGSLPLIDGVRTGEFDLAFTQFVGGAPLGLKAWMLACEPLVAICAPGHALAGRRNVTLGDLTAETFVDLRRDWGTRQLIDQSFSESRLTRKICFEVNDPATQLDLVAHGLGIALVPKAVIRGHGMSRMTKQLGVVELAGPEIHWELAAVFPRDEARQPLGVVTRTFLEFLRASITLLDESEVATDDIAMAG
jgi:DNA-binding transcriptional LysR family regulator